MPMPLRHTALAAAAAAAAAAAMIRRCFRFFLMAAATAMRASADTPPMIAMPLDARLCALIYYAAAQGCYRHAATFTLVLPR